MNWTPIKESLPPESCYREEYWVTVSPSVGCRFVIRAYYQHQNWEFYGDDGLIDHYNYGWEVVAWLPIEKPLPFGG